MLDIWPSSYIEWRWGSLLEVLEHLVYLRAPLMLLWDSKKLVRGLDLPEAKAAAEAEREKQPHGRGETSAQYGQPSAPKEAGAIIHNPLFWSYVDLLLMGSEVLAVMFSRVQ